MYKKEAPMSDLFVHGASCHFYGFVHAFETKQTGATSDKVKVTKP